MFEPSGSEVREQRKRLLSKSPVERPKDRSSEARSFLIVLATPLLASLLISVAVFLLALNAS